MKLMNADFSGQTLATSSGEIVCDASGVADVKDQSMVDFLMRSGWTMCSPAKKEEAKKEEVKEEVSTKKLPKK